MNAKKRKLLETTYREWITEKAKLKKLVAEKTADLAKKNRELEVETALERVRAASMAMRQSKEMAEVVVLILSELRKLGLPLNMCFINIIHKKELDIETWITFEEVLHLKKVRLPLMEYIELEKKLRDLKREGKKVTFSLRGQEVVDYNEAMHQLSGDNVFVARPFPAFRDTLLASNKFGSIGICSDDQPMVAEAQFILPRFSQVFEQTYTRFLDLQRAETQAREAQIEAALERVRSRAMAMRKSTELSDAAELLYKELTKLGLTSFSCGYLINDNEKMVWDIYLTNPGETAFKEFWTCPMEGDAFLKARYQSWKQKEPFYQAVLEGEANRKHHEFIAQFAPWKAEIVDLLPPKLVFNSANFSFVHLLVITFEALTPELEEAMVRFASVFDLTYRRFLDLEKAEEQNRQLEKVFNENQRLLHSILPEPIAEKIRQGQQTIVKRFEQVSILFADIVGFTQLAEKITPKQVVDILNGLFSRFDDLTDKYQLEKIKTIGDAYMVAAGVPEEKTHHAQLMFAFAKEMLETLQDFNLVIGTNLKIRIGISSGPVVAGVIGKKKFAYDLWGDTVNTAARMEAYGQQDGIQISPTTYAILKKEATFKKIPNVEIKGKGMMDVYVWVP